jgi:allophanate hydrolase
MSGKALAEFRADLAMAGSVEAAASGWLRQLSEIELKDPAIWISRFSDEEILARARELDRLGPTGRPLFGLPFAVKDNIDVRGLSTTAACPAFAYEPKEDAFVVRALLEAGGICVGKTNLDQFATGLVGVRSPYGVPKNAVDPAYIPGGSSSGSAVAVARGLVAFALGTDTAGSGRVPAAFNGIFGWKPTRGLLSTRGVVPACRSLDCVSIFAASASDCAEVGLVAAGYDEEDAWSREVPTRAGQGQKLPCRIAIPLAEEMEWFGDAESAECWQAAVEHLREQGHAVIEVSFRAFFEAARLLYEGPWVAERYSVIRTLLQTQPEAVHPITREIIGGGERPAAWETFVAIDRLAQLRRTSEAVWEKVDALALPTTGTIYRLEEVEAEPFKLNSNLGYYTNFFNLLDLCGLACPAGWRRDGLPFGITFAAPAFADELVWRLGGADLTRKAETATSSPRKELAVFGAHMRGLPLSARLVELGGEFLREATTAPQYQMVALDALRPGVIRRTSGGSEIALEVWSLPAESLGILLGEIPSPLGLGRVQLSDGREICGFLCEAYAAEGKLDISALGGWRSHLASRNPSG